MGGGLLSLIERIERLEEERAALAGDIKDVKAEAKASGFDPKVIMQMLRERRMSASQRAEWQALCETYRAALGMLDGTPLGAAARRRFMDPPPPPAPPSAPPPASAAAPGSSPDADADADAAAGPVPAEAPEVPPRTPGADDVKAARAEGAEAAREGVKVTGNPYAFDDPRRAAWDEGWCGEAGSDGMDLPAAWRRAKPPKDGDKGGAPAGAKPDGAAPGGKPDGKGPVP